MEQLDGKKVMLFVLRSVLQEKQYKYKNILGNKTPMTYVPLFKDFLDYRYFTREGIAQYLYENCGYGIFSIRSWKRYWKCAKCNLRIRDKKQVECPNCGTTKKKKFMGFYNLCTYEIIKIDSGFNYNPIDISNIARTKVWRKNLKRFV